MTIRFILTEVEEKEREDVFRLKRFKQLRNRKQQNVTDVHVCCCCLSMLASEEDMVESTCPVCKKAAKAKGKQSELKVDLSKSAEGQSKENKKMLDHLMSHIDVVIDLTRQYTQDGIVPASMDKFIKTCNMVKEKIEDYAPSLCDVSNKFLGHSGSREKLASGAPSKVASSKSLDMSCGREKQTKGPPCTESCYNLAPETDDKLGYFEKKFKEIVKVTRLQNEDGSVSEEKQVITIRTERRNPRKIGTLEPKSDDDNFTFPGVGKSCSKDYGGGTDYGGDEGEGGAGGKRTNFHSGPRETKSEHANRSHQMGEPRLRSCMSASHPKSTMNKDVSTNFDSSSMAMKTSMLTLPSEPQRAKPSCGPMISNHSSMDSHVCCPQKTESVGVSEYDSRVSSQTSVPYKPVLKSSSAQTCCKEISVKKPVEDKGTCCLPKCGGDKTSQDDEINKFRTTSTDALWRDAWTSTTNLTVEPSRTPSKAPSKVSKNRSPSPSCSSKDSIEIIGKEEKKGGCCTIKIIAKPPKVCCFEEKPKEQPDIKQKEMYLPGSMFETIKNIFLPPTRSSESCKVEPKEPEIKNICKSCLSKPSSFSSKPSVKSESSSCKMCQASIASAQREESKSCQSCGPLPKSLSCSSMSCKSMAIGSDTEKHTCMKSPPPSLHSQKHTCCLSKSKSQGSTDEEDESTCCAMAQTNKSSKSICCSKKASKSVCCPGKLSSKTSDDSKKSNTSVESSKCPGSCVSKTDVSTSTKRSARFDVRPLRRHTCEKINLRNCTCSRSDSNFNRKTHRPAKRCRSFYEDEYYYFRW